MLITNYIIMKAISKRQKIEKIKQDVLRKISPKKDEEKRIREFVRNLLRIAKLKTGLDAVVVGSIGKGTWLRGDHDIDLFILFPKSTSREDLEGKGLYFGKQIVREMKGDYKVKYAEHPYVHAIIEDYEVDIVPCYRIKMGERIISAVDRSPLHLEYVLTHFEENEKLINDARLLKQFMKGIGVYSSDAKNLGFSGYVCELLILKYGSFQNVLRAASKWSAPQIIDIERHVDRNTMKKYRKTKFRDQPLIIIDPVDSERNASAIVSPENFVKFIISARAFLDEPSEKFFFPKKAEKLKRTDINKIKNRKTEFLAIVFKKPDVIDDILYPQLRRALKRISNLMRSEGFMPIRRYEFVDNKTAFLIFEMEVWELPNVVKMIGPPIFSKKHTNEFLTKYKKPMYGPYIEGTKWVIEKERDYKSATELLEKFLAKDPKELSAAGIPSKLCKDIFKAKVLPGKEFWKVVAKNKMLSSFLKEKYFQRLSN